MLKFYLTLCSAIILCMFGFGFNPFAAPAQAATYDCDAPNLDIPAEECRALIDLYNATAGHNWTDNAAWLSDDPLCTWAGVTCEDGQISALELPSNNLRGNLPASLSDLSALRGLKLYQNVLRGAIPPELWRAPALEIVWLSRNQLSEGLSDHISAASSLRELILTSNSFSGDLPNGLWMLTQLEVLALSNNEFSGALPQGIGQLANLRGLYLADNRFRGELPPTLGDLIQLETLDLRFNAFAGEIPSSFSRLSALDVGNDGTYFTVEGLNLPYNALSSNDPDLRAFLELKNPEWQITQTAPPADLHAQPINAYIVELNWRPAGYLREGSSYEVYRASAGSDNWELVGTTNDTVYRVDGLTPATAYDFQVVSFTPQSLHNNNALRSAASPAISASTAPPSFTSSGGEMGEPVNMMGYGSGTTSSPNIQDFEPDVSGFPPPVVQDPGSQGIETGIVRDEIILDSSGRILSAILPVGMPYPPPGSATIGAYEVNLRRQPSVGSERIAILKIGRVYPIIGRAAQNNWLQINADGLVGWVDARFVGIAPDWDIFSAIPITFNWITGPIVFGTVNVTDGFRLMVRHSPRMGQTYRQEVVTNFFPRGYKSAVLEAGESVIILGRSGDQLWARIIAAGVVGWVYSDYLNILGNFAALPIMDDAPDSYSVYATINHYLYAGPSERYIIVGAVKDGQHCYVIGESADRLWLHIQTLDGVIGWAPKNIFHDSTTGLPIGVQPAPIPGVPVDIPPALKG